MNGNGRRVAVTGLGMVTPLGNDAASTWEGLVSGRSGTAPITVFDAAGFPVRIAAEVKDLDPAALIDDRKLLKSANRYQKFGLVAAAEAMRDAGIQPDESTAGEWGCVVGCGMMGVDFDELEDVHRYACTDDRIEPERLVNGGLRFDPIRFCRSQPTTGMSLLLSHFGIRGHSSSVHTACASGGQAVGSAMRLIREGTVERALAGGFDSMINPIGLASFCFLGALSPDNDTPERASRPFDATRNGFVLGEGAGFLVLEEWEAAVRRGAHIYAELAGDGNSLSSYRITDSHPSGDGPIQSMRQALRSAGADLTDVDYVNAHGTSTPMNDRSECAAIHALFGPQARSLAVSSTKSLTGHLIAGAGAVEAAVCALAIDRSLMPPSANMVEDDPDCDLDFVRDGPRPGRVGIAISNSFGFGGSNSCVVLRNPDEVDG